MKNILLLTLIIPALSACGSIGKTVGTLGTAAKIAVDILVENDTAPENENDTAVAFTAE